MEQMANPGTIVISEYTRKLTEGYFELKALGAADIKGVEEPLNVYEVLGPGPLRTRLQMSARRGLTRFVGRHSQRRRRGGSVLSQGHYDYSKTGSQVMGAARRYELGAAMAAAGEDR